MTGSSSSGAGFCRAANKVISIPLGRTVENRGQDTGNRNPRRQSHGAGEKPPAIKIGGLASEPARGPAATPSALST